MRPAPRSMVLIGVVSVFLTFTYVLAQVPAGISSPADDPPKKQAAEDKKEARQADQPAPVAPPIGAPAAADAAVPAPKADAQRDAQVQQWIQQFRPMLHLELQLVRTACKLTKEQRIAITRDGEQALKDTAKQYAEMQNKVRVLRFGAQAEPADPRKRIQEGLMKAVKAHLSPDQIARYQDEFEKRTAHRKQVAIRNLIVLLDQNLVLSAEQRDKISESLSLNWDDSWCQSLDIFLNGNPFCPDLPEKFVVPFLTETQKKAWHGTPKNQLGGWGGFGFMAVEMFEPPNGEEPKAEPDQEDEKP
jgi:hypothetical protein